MLTREAYEVFVAGRRQAEMDDERPQTSCPYSDDSEQARWWNLGYVYEFRILRAMYYKAQLEKLGWSEQDAH